MRLPSSRVGLVLAALYAVAAAVSMGLWYYAHAVADTGIYGEGWGMRAGLLAAPWYFVPALLTGRSPFASVAWTVGVVINAALVYHLVRAVERWRARRRPRAI